MMTAFVRWHLSIGFMRIYLYFDNPKDEGILLAKALRREAAQRYRSDDAVRVVVCDSSLRAAWSDLTMAQRWGHDYSQVVHHVEVRQLLNAEHCLRSAHADGDVDWLLHIDSDELFHIADGDAASHFGRLSAHGCVNYRYPIHEGCPEAIDTPNVFASVTLFRRHQKTLAAAIGTDPAERAAAVAALEFWDPIDGRHYNLGSPQGKSATRVMAGVLPLSVHAFAPPSADMVPRCFAGFADDQDAVAENAKVVAPMGAPCILHYISCDFSFWWHKYELLGRFGSEKPGGHAVGGHLDPECFHAISRDLVAVDGDKQRAREVYAASVCLLDPHEAERQVESRVCMRLTSVRDALSSVDAQMGGAAL